ncbi:MAG: amidase [Alphaproteobacteria bacterium]|jgi:acetamidase/formamidase|nr:amidase [Alphaproteobacteria bacterium]
MAHHVLPASPETCFWGFFAADTAPVLHVASGDEVTVEALPAGGVDDLHPDTTRCLPEHRATLEGLEPAKGPGVHLMNGPVHVDGAAPGDVLQVDILESWPRQDWGFAKIIPLLGTLPEDFGRFGRWFVDMDRDAGEAVLPWHTRLPLAPFFGVLAVAPPAAWGAIDTAQPRAHGGNMDNKELRPGATLYLPVFQEGALFSAGDGHGLQGDGEVCVTGLETSLTGRFRLTVRKDLAADLPFAETADHLIAMGFDADLDDAAKTAVRRMIDLICERTERTREEAYVLASLAADFRVTQLVDGEKGIHGLLAKSAL